MPIINTIPIKPKAEYTVITSSENGKNEIKKANRQRSTVLVPAFFASTFSIRHTPEDTAVVVIARNKTMKQIKESLGKLLLISEK